MAAPPLAGDCDLLQAPETENTANLTLTLQCKRWFYRLEWRQVFFSSSKRLCSIHHLSNETLANALVVKFVLGIHCIFSLFSASAGMIID